MPAVIPWVDEVLQKLVSDPDSCIFLDQKSIQVVLQPFHLQDLKSAVRDLLNESVDSYHKSLNGILLSYKRLKVVNKSARVAAETSGLVLDIEADFYVFRPEVGSVLKGVVNKVSNDHVGALLHHRFNISCPRPSVESKSVKWLGNKVVMSQEVIIKVKEKDFAGKMPFFKGKLLEIGRVLAEEERKSNKKKKTGEASIVEAPDMSEPSSTPTPKKRKLKLEETQDEIKVKKSKKEPKTDDMKSSVVGILKSEQIVPEKPSAKKKKKMSVGSVDDVDFIPRLSLDVSQLPEDLPPPNADSTHFDLAKANSSLTGKSEKKKKTNLGLSAIREESADGMKGFSNVNNMNLTGKSQKSIEDRSSKKKKKDEVKQDDADGKKKLSKKEMSYESSVGEKVQDQNPLPKKETKAKKSKELQSQSNPDANTQQAPSKSKKKQKEKGLENASLTNSMPAFTESISSSLTKETKAKKGKELQSKLNPVAIEQHASDAGKELQTPSKSKKKQKEKALDSSSLHLDRGKKPTPASGDTTKDSQTASKSKKKLKEEKSPTQLKKKDRELQDILTNDYVDSDDTIPPGQKLVRESPVKQVGSSGKRSSLSVSFGKNPEISYFSAGDNVMNLGSRKGDRQTPLMFGTMDGKVIPPPESPVKRSPTKKPRYSDSDSDSDAPSPKKMAAVSPKKGAVLSPVKKEIVLPVKNTKIDDSDSDAEPPSPRKVVVTSTRKVADDSDSEVEAAPSNNTREHVYDSDDSDEITSAQNKLLQSMGVMQSPLKSARPNVKQDSSDSDSDGSSKANNRVSPGQSKSSLTKLGNGPTVKAKSKKNILANSNSSEKNLPSKAPQATKSKPTKTPRGKKVSAPVVPLANDTDSGDSDLDVEVMRRALLAAVTEPTKIGRPKKGTKSPAKATPAKATPAKATPAKNTPKKPKPIAKSTPEPVRGVSQNLSVGTDSDSGPDDRNTTLLLSEIRERKESELKGKKKPNAKQVKGKKALVPTISEDSKKDKGEVKEPKKKQETKGKGKKKPSADEEISDVMQRLLQQAKLNIGMS